MNMCRVDFHTVEVEEPFFLYSPLETDKNPGKESCCPPVHLVLLLPFASVDVWVLLNS